MDEPVALGGEGHVGNALGGLAPEEEEIAGTDVLDRDRHAVLDLEGGVPRQQYPARREGGLHQPGAIDAPGRHPAPQVGRSGEALHRPSLGRERRGPPAHVGGGGDLARRERGDAAVREPDALPGDRDPGPQREPHQVGADPRHGAEAPARGVGVPGGRRIRRELEQIAGVHPPEVSVEIAANPAPLPGRLLDRGGLAQHQLAHLLGAERGLGLERDQRRSGGNVTGAHPDLILCCHPAAGRRRLPAPGSPGTG